MTTELGSSSIGWQVPQLRRERLAARRAGPERTRLPNCQDEGHARVCELQGLLLGRLLLLEVVSHGRPPLRSLVTVPGFLYSARS